MKTLKFRSVLAEMILRGEKKTTFRLFDDKDIRAGDELELVNWETKQPFGKAVVLEAYDKEFEQLRCTLHFVSSTAIGLCQRQSSELCDLE